MKLTRFHTYIHMFMWSLRKSRLSMPAAQSPSDDTIQPINCFPSVKSMYLSAYVNDQKQKTLNQAAVRTSTAFHIIDPLLATVQNPGMESKSMTIYFQPREVIHPSCKSMQIASPLLLYIDIPPLSSPLASFIPKTLTSTLSGAYYYFSLMQTHLSNASHACLMRKIIPIYLLFKSAIVILHGRERSLRNLLQQSQNQRISLHARKIHIQLRLFCVCVTGLRYRFLGLRLGLHVAYVHD